MEGDPLEAASEFVASAKDVEAPSTTGSILGNLQAKARQHDQREPLELAIPRFEGDLVALYEPIEWKIVNQIIHRIEKSKDEMAELYAAADLLARACADFKVRVDDNLVSISEVADDLEDGTPVRYDQNLAKALGIEDQIPSQHKGRQTVLAVFKNDFAVVSHQNQVVEWLRGEEADADF